MFYQLSPQEAAWLSVKEMATSLRKFLWLRDWNNSCELGENKRLSHKKTRSVIQIYVNCTYMGQFTCTHELSFYLSLGWYIELLKVKYITHKSTQRNFID